MRISDWSSDVCSSDLGWLLGWYADRHGRKAALLLSVWLMCFGSLAIACTPGYATIGVAAPILLVISRPVQGLAHGGEYGPYAPYQSEMAPRGPRGFDSKDRQGEHEGRGV